MKKISLAALPLLILLSLVACGGQDSRNTHGEIDSPQADGADTYMTGTRWIYNGGADTTSVYPLYLAEEVSGLDVEPDSAYDGRSVTYCALGNIIYGLEDFYRKTGDRWEHFYYISRFDGSDEDVTHWPIKLPPPEDYGVSGYAVASFDIKGEDELVVFLQGQQDQLLQQGCYLAVHMTPEGKILSVTDLYTTLLELNVEMEALYEKAYVDGAGYYYLISGRSNYRGGNSVSVLDPAGKIMGTITSEEGYAGVEWAMKLPDGSVVFSWLNPEQMRIMMQAYDREKNAAYTLLEGEQLIDAWLWTPGADGHLYYVNSFGNLMRCDIQTGSVEECIYYPQLGLDGDRHSPYLVRMLIGADSQSCFLLGSKGGKTVICRLSTEKPETESICLLSNGRFSDYIKNCASSFSQKNPDCPAVLEYPEENADTYWDRAMAALASGKGADIYYVSSDEMRILQQKGVLADLSALISEETLSALWPAALEMGTVDGQLVGIPLEANVESMLISDEIWAGDCWTLEEALDVLEAHPEKQYPVMSHIAFDSYDVLSWLVLESLDNSPFLDIEKGTCDFDNPLFIRALKLAGSYTKSFSFEDAQTLYPEKDWVAMQIPINIRNFEDFKSNLGENYHVVGFPTEGKSGTYWSNGTQLVVVNKNLLLETEHAEEIGLFLEEMLSRDRQCMLNVNEPVRRNMLDNRLKPHTLDGTTGMYIEYGNGLMKELTPGPQGDYRIGEFNAIMENSVGRSVDTNAIESIITEEAGSYFSGDKDIAAVASIIQNRVQLYLNERQ